MRRCPRALRLLGEIEVYGDLYQGSLHQGTIPRETLCRGTLHQEPLGIVYFSVPLARQFRRTVYLSHPAAFAIDVQDHSTGKARMQGKERT